MSVINPVQSHDHEGRPVGKEVKLRWEGFVEKVGFACQHPSFCWVLISFTHGGMAQTELTCGWFCAEAVYLS